MDHSKLCWLTTSRRCRSTSINPIVPRQVSIGAWPAGTGKCCWEHLRLWTAKNARLEWLSTLTTSVTELILFSRREFAESRPYEKRTPEELFSSMAPLRVRVPFTSHKHTVPSSSGDTANRGSAVGSLCAFPGVYSAKPRASFKRPLVAPLR